jgi:hypothetical protein
MKKFGFIVMLVMGLVLYVGFAAAEEPALDTFTFMDLSLTFDVPATWTVTMDREAQRILDENHVYDASAFEDFICHSIIIPPEDGEAWGTLCLFSAKNPTPGISSYQDYSDDDLLNMGVPILTPDQMIVNDPSKLVAQNTGVARMPQAQFVVSSYYTEDGASIVASTVEHGRFIWFEFVYSTADNTMLQAFVDLLLTCRFVDVPPITTSPGLVTDVLTWEDHFASVMMSLYPEKGKFRHTPVGPGYLPDDGRWLIDRYELPTLVWLYGKVPNVIDLIVVSAGWDKKEPLADIEEQYCAISFAAMMATSGETDHNGNEIILEYMQQKLEESKAAALPYMASHYYVFKGVFLALMYGPYDDFVGFSCIIGILP